MLVKSRLRFLFLLGLLSHYSLFSVTNTEVFMSVVRIYASMARDFLNRINQPAPPPEVTEIDLAMIRRGFGAIAGGASSVWGFMRLRSAYSWAGGAALGALGGYVAYRVRANSQQIEAVHQQVVANGEDIAHVQESVDGVRDAVAVVDDRVGSVQTTLHATRTEIAEGFARTDDAIDEAQVALQHRIDNLREFIQTTLHAHSEDVAHKHGDLLRNIQQLQQQLTCVSQEKDKQYGGLLAQLTALEATMSEQSRQTERRIGQTERRIGQKIDVMSSSFAASEQTTQAYVDQRFDRIEEMLASLASGAGASSSSSCHSAALTYVPR